MYWCILITGADLYSREGDQITLHVYRLPRECNFTPALLSASPLNIPISHPFAQVYVPLGTLIVSSSFALGSSLSNIVSSLVFVLVTRPYECSDRITASGEYHV